MLGSLPAVGQPASVIGLGIDLGIPVVLGVANVRRGAELVVSVPGPIEPRATRRRPVWSHHLTVPLAARIPTSSRAMVLRGIKAVHTAAFVAISASIALVAIDGIRGRSDRGVPLRRRTAVAAGIAVAESVVYASNNQVCPLTPLAEELGAESGSVTDLYLPRWMSDRVPLVGGTALVIGLALQVAAWRRSGRDDDHVAVGSSGNLGRHAAQDQSLEVRPRP